MKKVWKPLVLLLVAGIMAADLILDAGATEPVSPAAPEVPARPVGTAVGEAAPELIGTTLDGEQVRLSALRGKTVLLNVFASWCGPCRVEAPHLVEVFEKMKDEDVVFLGLNLQESPDAVAGFQADFRIPFPLILNQDGKLTEIYRPIGLPTSWFIDPDGVIQYVHAGPITSEILQRALEDVRAGRQPNPFAPSG